MEAWPKSDLDQQRDQRLCVDEPVYTNTLLDGLRNCAVNYAQLRRSSWYERGP